MDVEYQMSAYPAGEVYHAPKYPGPVRPLAPGAATADSALLCIVMARYASLARRVDHPGAALAVPEIAWTAFATVLSAAVAGKSADRLVRLHISVNSSR